MITHRCTVPPLFFFNDTATTEIYTLSLHDALPISASAASSMPMHCASSFSLGLRSTDPSGHATSGRSSGLGARSEEHTSELQPPCKFGCRLLLEKKNADTPPIRERGSRAVISLYAH